MQLGLSRRDLASIPVALSVALFLAPAALAVTPNLRIESNRAGAFLAESMANAGDVNGDGIDDLIVGATDWNDDGLSPEGGAVFIFHGGPGGLSTGDVSQADTTIISTQPGGRFGTSVSSAGDVNGDGYGDVIIGAGGWDEGQDNEGAAFIFHGGPDGIASGDASLANTLLEGDWVNARLGTSVSHADINGDGYDDVLSGGRLYQFPNEQTEEGYVLIFLGSEDGVADGGRLTAHAQIEANRGPARMGESVAGVGDVNDDGYEDILIGAPRYNGGLVREGAAFLYLGSETGIPSGDPTTADATLEGEQIDGRFGRRVIGLGDVNADGFDDVAVAATIYDNGQLDEGAVFVFHGSAGGLVGAGPIVTPADAVAIFDGGQTDASLGLGRDYFGSAMAVGDWDGDTYTDLLITSPYHEGTFADEGGAFLFRGSATGFSSASAAGADRQFFSGVPQGWAGVSVALIDIGDEGLAEPLLGGNRLGHPVATQQSEGMVLGFPRVTDCENLGDDDGDGFVDLADAGCTSADDLREEIDFSTPVPTTISNARTDTILSRDVPNGAPTRVLLGTGGSTTRDFVSIEGSRVELTGGSVAGDMIAMDAASALIQSGSVAGSVVGLGNAFVTIRGGTVVAIEARDEARIELHGLSFVLPLGDVVALAGTIQGTLEDGTPIDASFERDETATVRLVPEPAATALGAAAALALGALRRRR